LKHFWHIPPETPKALRRTTACQTATQDALRSLGEGGLTYVVAICDHPHRASEGEGRVHYVYLLQSERFPDQRYIGVTSDLKQRIPDHNSGKSAHTSKYVPWKLVTHIAFSDKQKAETFERYLKSGSGHAFAKKRLW
jgi:putative endonuclease